MPAVIAVRIDAVYKLAVIAWAMRVKEINGPLLRELSGSYPNEPIIISSGNYPFYKRIFWILYCGCAGSWIVDAVLRGGNCTEPISRQEWTGERNDFHPLSPGD